MARSALDILNEHIWGGQAKLAAYRKQYSGSGQYVAPTSFKEADEKLLESLMVARDLLYTAQFGRDDALFVRSLRNWAGMEYGAFFYRDTLLPSEHLPRPKKPELLRECPTLMHKSPAEDGPTNGASRVPNSCEHSGQVLDSSKSASPD